MKVFKIRNKNTGLFSTGGMQPKWSKNGKTWNGLNYVHSHIAQLHSNYTPAEVYNDSEIVEAEITEILNPVEPANKHLIKKMDEIIDHYEIRINENPETKYYHRWLEEARGRRALMK